MHFPKIQYEFPLMDLRNKHFTSRSLPFICATHVFLCGNALTSFRTVATEIFEANYHAVGSLAANLITRSNIFIAPLFSTSAFRRFP